MEFNSEKNGLPSDDPMRDLTDAIGDLSDSKTRGTRIGAAVIPIYYDADVEIFDMARRSATGAILSVLDTDIAPGTRNDTGAILTEDRVCAALVQVDVQWFLSVSVERNGEIEGVVTPLKSIVHPLWHAVNRQHCATGSVRYVDDAGPRDSQNKSASDLLVDAMNALRAASVRATGGGETSVSDPPTAAERVLATRVVELVRDIDAIFATLKRAQGLVEQPPITDAEKGSKP